MQKHKFLKLKLEFLKLKLRFLRLRGRLTGGGLGRGRLGNMETTSCFCIAVFIALQFFLHCSFFCIAVFSALQFFLHCSFSALQFCLHLSAGQSWLAVLSLCLT